MKWRLLNNASLKSAWAIMFFSAVLSIIPSHVSLAATNQLIITTDSTYQMTTGTTFSVSVKAFIGSDAAPQTAIGSVKYPSNKLKYVSSTSNGSGFGNPLISASSGNVGFNASRSSTSKGVVKVFDISFQAIGAGTAIVEFTGDSRVNNTTTTYKSAVFSVTNPTTNPTPPAPKPTVSTKPSVAPVPISPVSPSPSPSIAPDIPVPTPDPNGVVVNVDVDPDYTSGVITWKVDATNPKSSLSYGAKSSDLSQRASVAKISTDTYRATITNLQPGERYYFTIAGSGDGDRGGTYSSTLTTNGYPVTISVTENNIIANGAQIRVDNITRVTGADGKATIGLATGEYTGKITTDTATKDIQFTVAKKAIPTDGSSLAAQTFSFDLTSSPLSQESGSGMAIITFIGVLIGGTALIGIGFIGFMAYRRRSFENSTSGGGSTQGTTVIIDDGYDWHQQVQQPSPGSYLPPANSLNSLPPKSHNNSVYIDDEEPIDIFDKK